MIGANSPDKSSTELQLRRLSKAGWIATFIYDNHIGVSKNSGTPKIIHFIRDFHYKPSILG